MPINLSTDGLQQEETEAFGMHLVKPDGKDVRTRPKPRKCCFCGRFIPAKGECPRIWYDEECRSWEHR